MKHLLFISAAIACVASLTGCQTVPYEGQARDIKLRPQKEGIVGIPVNGRPEDRTKAMEKIKINCSPGEYEILEEGEVVVGQETKTNTRQTDRASTERKAGSLFGIPLVTGEAGGQDTQASAITTAVKEWQISYKCLAASNRSTKLR